MKTLEKGQDKIERICSVLRDETLAPAQKQAQNIVEEAQAEAQKIIANAQKEAEKIHKDAKASIEQEYSVFQSSLQQAAKQALESLKQNIEHKFFNDHLSALIEKGANDPNLIAALINAIVKALEKEGLATNLTAVVAKSIVPRQLNELLLKDVLDCLKDQSVAIGNLNAGVQLKVNQKNMTIDISEAALRELLGTYVVRKDFRKMIFNDRN